MRHGLFTVVPSPPLPLCLPFAAASVLPLFFVFFLFAAMGRVIRAQRRGHAGGVKGNIPNVP